MKRVLMLMAAVAGCASAPAPRVPDGSHRIPVNTVVPPEAGGQAERDAPGPWRAPKPAGTPRAREEGR